MDVTFVQINRLAKTKVAELDRLLKRKDIPAKERQRLTKARKTLASLNTAFKRGGICGQPMVVSF